MPYNPGIQYRGDQYLFQGIAGAGNALAEGVQQFRKDRRESEFLDAQAESLGRILGQSAPDQGGAELLQTLGKVPSMSLNKKRGALASVMFGIAEREKEAERAAVQKRADQRTAVDERQLQLQQATLDRLLGNDRQRAAAERDSVGMMLGLSGQTKLPSPVDPSKAGEYWAQRYPNASSEVIARILDQTGPDAQRRLAISEGNLRVAESQVRNREREINQEGQPKARMVKVTEKAGEDGTAYTYEMPWDEYQALKAETEKARKDQEPVTTTPAEPSMWQKLTGAKPPPVPGKVLMLNPDGRRGWVAEADVQRAIEKGYKRAN